jgi:hypothetical protein
VIAMAMGPGSAPTTEHDRISCPDAVRIADYSFVAAATNE